MLQRGDDVKRRTDFEYFGVNSVKNRDVSVPMTADDSFCEPNPNPCCQHRGRVERLDKHVGIGSTWTIPNQFPSISHDNGG